MSSGNIVKLNIGGTVFQTSKSTLTKFDGFFKVMLETDLPVEKDESGCMFIDRSPKHFDMILNFMRDGKVELPKSQQELKEIQTEAQFYLLNDLTELCSARIKNEIRVIESESEYLQIIANPIKPVLVIHYPVAPDLWRFYPDGFDIDSFLEKHKNHMDIYFKPCQCEDSWYTLHKNNHSIRGVNPFDKSSEVRFMQYLYGNSNKMRVIESNREIIANPGKAVMIIICPLNPSSNEIGLSPHEFNVNDFLEKHKNHFDIYFKPSGDSSYRSIEWVLNKSGRQSIYCGIMDPEHQFLESIERSITDFLKH